LRAPAGRATRPTSDRVREAMFSILASLAEVEGAVVLDLFAGSGALGIEALSRGAARAVFVERDRAALAAIRANLEVLEGGAGRAEVVGADVFRYLATAPGSPAPDPSRRPPSPPSPDPARAIPVIALADPPYAFDGWDRLLAGLAGRASLLMAETAVEWAPSDGWETVKVRRYGGTVVTVVQPLAGRSR